MRRTAVVLVLLGLVGCSTAPIAGFLDLVAPGRIRDGGSQPYGGVCVPHPVGGVVPPAGLPAITGEPPPGTIPLAPTPTPLQPGVPPPPPLVPPEAGVPVPQGAVAVPPGTLPSVAAPPAGFAAPPPGGPAPPAPPLTPPGGPPPAGAPPR